MKRIKVMVNGMPGNVAGNIAKHILKDDRFELVRYSTTGPDILDSRYLIDDIPVQLLTPDVRDAEIIRIKEAEGPFITVDFTLPLAVNDNAKFYCRHELPFVMGTTGGDRVMLEKEVCNASIPAVIAPNMAKQIVGFQAMMAYAAENFPGLFDGYSLEIRESHQQTKVDTSGTAKAMVTYFNKLGVNFAENDIIKIRDPEIQQHEWKIPEQYLNGHAWHTYTLDAPDKTARFQFSHNINGRDIYSWGTFDAILFLQKKIDDQIKGNVFTMIDVLKGG
ncbi:MAG: dihydrodipicolinate reductase [Desulfobacteraceae bacterium]|jgi:4-hydroxy-tetrahydrodipicolinate reductase|nr:dihydrodipicolinate reductase [Desulfobacteraceae bacterium]